jgi:hypothetical protein
MLTFSTWESMAKRHVWYRDVVLVAKMKEWPDQRIDECSDPMVLQRVIKLAARVERHQLRMDRHMQRGLAALGTPPKALRRN